MIELQVRRIFASPRARKIAESLEIPLDRVEGSGPAGRIIEEDVRFYWGKNESGYTECRWKPLIEMEETKATPLAKKIAKVENIDLNLVEGSGCSGKILGSDVLKLVPDVNRKSPDSVHTPVLRTPMLGIRKIIAERMAYSKRISPHVTITVKAEVTKMVEFRNKWLQEVQGTKLSYTDILIKVVAQSLRNHSRINVSLDQEEIVHHQDCHIGVAVAFEDGLIVPVIHYADQKPLAEISKELKDKVNRVKQGKLMPEDLRNGRFTISNLGMYEVDAFTPIINPPESAILGVGRIIEDLIVQNGQIRIGKTMVLSLSFDHRVIDGAPAAIFLKNIKDLLEKPELLNSLDKGNMSNTQI